MAEELQFCSEPARDGNPYMSVVTASGAVRLNSNYRPVSEAEKWAAGLDIARTGAILLMFGMGNGYCLRKLLGRLPQDAAVLLYEPSAGLFDYVKENYALGDILSDRRLRLVIAGRNDAQLYILLDQLIHWSNAKKQCFCFHPQYDKLFPEQFAHFSEIIRANNVRVFTNRNTEMHFGQAIAKNVANNLRYVPNAKKIQEFSGKFPKDLPAILVAAGPSLDKNIDELKNAKGKAFIIAVDTAMHALHSHNILPDAVVSIDAGIREKHVVGTAFQEVPLFAKAQSNDRIMQLHHAEKIWFDSHEYLERFYQSIHRSGKEYRAGASVATAAFSICAALQFRRIILIGQDLAYFGEVTHVGGTIRSIQAEEENICYVDAAYGGKVRTRHDWLQYLRWFERVVLEVKGEIEVIDATEGGARIQGTVLMPLAEAIRRYCRDACDISKIWKTYGKALTKEEQRQFSRYVQQSISEAEQLKKLAIDICDLCDREESVQEQVASQDKERRCEERLEFLHGEIAKKNEEIQKMNFYLLADDYTKQVSIPAITKLMEMEGTAEECFLLHIAENRRIYKALADAADALLPALNAAEKAIR